LIWLGSSRGYAADWVTQRWVQLSGRRVRLKEAEWLSGPTGPTTAIGPQVFERDASARGLVLRDDDGPIGLIPDFSSLASNAFDPGQIEAAVRDFYQQTSRYEVDVWSEWRGAFKPFGRLLAVLFSRRLQQLNVPLSPLDTSQGIESRLFQYRDPSHNQVAYTAWVRRLIGSGNVLYAAAYSTTEIPGQPGFCVKVVFPLPNGNAVILMRPEAHADGSFSLVSSGRNYGETGFYFTVMANEAEAWVRYLPTLRETITVYPDGPSARANHLLTLWGAEVLHLHYRLRLTP
jgi:hypothetical protein